MVLSLSGKNRALLRADGAQVQLKSHVPNRIGLEVTLSLGERRTAKTVLSD